MHLEKYLNPEQKKAAETLEGPVLILAGAGSGKTRTITYRIANLLEQNVSPWNILAITFTNKAAGEMRERVDRLVGFGADSIWVATFHSTCVRILRRHADLLGYDQSFSIYDADDQKTLMKNICKEMNIDTKKLKEKTILNTISSNKDELVSPEEYDRMVGSDPIEKKIAEAYHIYQKQLKSNNAMDFDDLIVNTVRLFQKHPEVLASYQERFRYIHVDEYQDTNTAQFELVRLLADRYRNLCVVGDDDQSIYRFRGANIHNILDFEKNYPEATVIKLEQNYRSTQNILNAANAVIANNQGRKDKSLWTDKGEGHKVHFRLLSSQKEEAEFIAEDIARKIRKREAQYKDCAVLYRTNAQSRELEERFLYDNMPYQIVGGQNFYGRKEIKDCLAYLKTIANGNDDLMVRRIINVPKRGIGNTSVDKAAVYAANNEISLFDALAHADRIPGLGKTAQKMIEFAEMVERIRSRMEDAEYYDDLPELLDDVLNESGYLEDLRVSNDEEDADRIGNLDELISKAAVYEEKYAQENPESETGPTLTDFLNEVSLVADIDNVSEENDRVLLMTLHAAKGLEFDHVYIAGMEDGLFPGDGSIFGGPEEMEEERRLAYVGMTRAKEELTLTAAGYRVMRGQAVNNPVSQFVREIPEEFLEGNLPRYRSFEDDFSGSVRTSFSGTSGIGISRPKAPTPRRDVKPEDKPYAAIKSLGALKKGSALTAGTTDYGVGDRVRHIKFGEGVVKNMESRDGATYVTVEFDTAGVRVLSAAFAKLQKL
ncbi:MAG: DNA helicase PcrA [Lachnospiraceae bacterium]|nr:DNA helicase PcrA [Lachnospiraceae bacterium]